MLDDCCDELKTDLFSNFPRIPISLVCSKPMPPGAGDGCARVPVLRDGAIHEASPCPTGLVIGYARVPVLRDGATQEASPCPSGLVMAMLWLDNISKLRLCHNVIDIMNGI